MLLEGSGRHGRMRGTQVDRHTIRKKARGAGFHMGPEDLQTPMRPPPAGHGVMTQAEKLGLELGAQ